MLMRLKIMPFQEQAATDQPSATDNVQTRLGIAILFYFGVAGSAFLAVLWPAAIVIAPIGLGYLGIQWCRINSRVQDRAVREIGRARLAALHLAGLAFAGVVGLSLAGYSPFGLFGQLVATSALLVAIAAAASLFWIGIRRRYPAARQLAIIISAAIFFAFVWHAAETASQREEMQNLTGVAFSLGAPEHWYDTGPSFNGDGYTIEQYRLPESVARQFLKLPAKAADRPMLHAPSASWKVVHWRTGPPDPSDMPYIDFALGASYGLPGDLLGQEREARRIQASARASLARQTTHFAYFYKASVFPDGRLWVQNVVLYVLDAPGHRFFRVDFDT
ncbi:MAG TPA: hypothetical protein VIK18_09685 [Pirellulales bacterium]